MLFLFSENKSYLHFLFRSYTLWVFIFLIRIPLYSEETCWFSYFYGHRYLSLFIDFFKVSDFFCVEGLFISLTWKLFIHLQPKLMTTFFTTYLCLFDRDKEGFSTYQQLLFDSVLFLWREDFLKGRDISLEGLGSRVSNWVWFDCLRDRLMWVHLYNVPNVTNLQIMWCNYEKDWDFEDKEVQTILKFWRYCYCLS